MRNDSFAKSGGASVLTRIANLATRKAVTDKSVRVIFSGSSSFVTLAFNKTVLRGGRRDIIYLDDYSQEVLVDNLVNLYHVPEQDAREFMDRVGSRLRLVDKLIHKDK